MISTKTNTNELQLAEPCFVQSNLISRPQVDKGLSLSRQWHLNRVVEEIEIPEVKKIVGRVFEDLLRLLECLNLIENHLRQVERAEESFAFFDLIHDEASCLVEFIRADGLSCEAMSEELADILDGISFAISHDLQRVFDAEPADRTAYGKSHMVLSRLHRAHDVLTNCLQQSTISLAVVFDKGLVGATLFNNSDARHRQSLQLCKDLATLRDLVASAEQAWDLAILSDLTFELERFRGESMECLMYSDWPQFEGFCEMITLSLSDRSRLQPVLHQFQCYLETLLGQVRMRAVLADDSERIPERNSAQLVDALHQGLISFNESGLDDIVPIGEYAMAVQ